MRMLSKCIFTVLIVLAGSCKEDDGQEIIANEQKVVDAIGHLWQISKIVYSHEDYEDSVITDVGEINFEPCDLSNQQVRECSGYHQVRGCSRVAFSYSVSQSPENFVYRSGEPIDGCLDISPGNVKIKVLTQDSLVFDAFTNKSRFRELGTGEDVSYSISTTVYLTKNP